jgi:hypothetical protein
MAQQVLADSGHWPKNCWAKSVRLKRPITVRNIMHSRIHPLIKLTLILVALSLSACVGVTVSPESMASMSDEPLCGTLGPGRLSSKEEQSLIRAELDRRGVVCDYGKIVGYRQQQKQTPATERLRFFCEPKEVSVITESETTRVEGYKGGWLFIDVPVIDVPGGTKLASLTVENPAGKRISFHGAYDQQITEEKRKEYDAMGYDVSVMVFSNRHMSDPEAKILMMVLAQPDDAVHVSALKKEEHADLMLQLPCAKSEKVK